MANPPARMEKKAVRTVPTDWRLKSVPPGCSKIAAAKAVLAPAVGKGHAGHHLKILGGDIAQATVEPSAPLVSVAGGFGCV